MKYIGVLLALCCCVVLTGCMDDADKSQQGIERVSKYQGVTGARTDSGGYFRYEIEQGTISCREHASRSELACWKVQPKE